MAKQHPSEERREARVEFLGEQDGPPERTLKDKLGSELRRHLPVKRAYLARVGFAPGAPVSVALCIAPQAAEQPELVADVGKIFAAQFATNAHLDILFPDEQQEVDLQRVCRPFFERR